MRKYLMIIFLSVCVTSSARNRQNFDADWLFMLADTASMSRSDYNDRSWRRLNLPHDWSIEGDFMASAPAGAGGGALQGGVGWYRKHFSVDAKQKDMLYYIQFDGVYMNSTVYINGYELGTRPYGFISFEYEISQWLNPTGDNVIAVRVDNSEQPNCRWYSGSGIYRHVYLLQTEKVHVAQWGVFAKPVLNAMNKAKVEIEVEVENYSSQVRVDNILLDAEGNVVGKCKSTFASLSSIDTGADKGLFKSFINVSNPKLWDTNSPYLYTLRTEVSMGGKVVDTYETPVGIRTFKFDAQKGFSLNGKSMKINGVCQHHDLGCLGSAVYEDALYRQLRMLRDMGANSVRCSHNPPAPELLQMCDTMGLIVMDESFDMWHRKKTQYDYSRYFDKWYERDLSDLVRRDRNHPSILIWSIGNEVLEQWSSSGSDELSIEQANLVLNFGHDASELATNGEKSVNTLMAERLADIVRALDDSRPITAGCNEPNPNNHLFKGNAMDIIGYNYHNQNVADVPKNFPGKPFIFTESNSALMTRGFYVNPSDSIIKAPVEWWMPYTDPSFQCSAYDNCRASWGNHHEETWDLIKHNDFVCGQYIWTGWDYIGEPTPYGFPARSSYFGIIDLAGFPKDIYYFYQSAWTDQPVLHLFPHWNWIPGQQLDMWCYYNQADEVELYINGVSQGVRRKGEHDYHVMWRVTYQPGEVKVVARKGGAEVRSQVIRTAGAPHHLRLSVDKPSVQSDGTGLAFVTVEVVDKAGNPCPNAENQVFFSLEGDAEIAGVDNGCQFSMERFKDNKRKAFYGKCLAVVQSGKSAGVIRLTAKAVDLEPATIEIQSK